MPANRPGFAMPEPVTPLLIYPDPRLKVVCDPFLITDFNDPTRRAVMHHMLNSMWDVLDHYNGWGLAAPQIGSPMRAIIVHIKKRSSAGCRIEIINPELEVMKRKGRFFSDEGCLSWPRHRKRVRRWQKVKVRGYDRDGNEVCFGGTGDQAAALQHEIQHLDGINLADL